VFLLHVCLIYLYHFFILFATFFLAAGENFAITLESVFSADETTPAQLFVIVYNLPFHLIACSGILTPAQKPFAGSPAACKNRCLKVSENHPVSAKGFWFGSLQVAPTKTLLVQRDNFK